MLYLTYITTFCLYYTALFSSLVAESMYIEIWHWEYGIMDFVKSFQLSCSEERYSVIIKNGPFVNITWCIIVGGRGELLCFLSFLAQDAHMTTSHCFRQHLIRRKTSCRPGTHKVSSFHFLFNIIKPLFPSRSFHCFIDKWRKNWGNTNRNYWSSLNACPFVLGLSSTAFKW